MKFSINIASFYIILSCYKTPIDMMYFDKIKGISFRWFYPFHNQAFTFKYEAFHKTEEHFLSDKHCPVLFVATHEREWKWMLFSFFFWISLVMITGNILKTNLENALFFWHCFYSYHDSSAMILVLQLQNMMSHNMKALLMRFRAKKMFLFWRWHCFTMTPGNPQMVIRICEFFQCQGKP